MKIPSRKTMIQRCIVIGILSIPCLCLGSVIYQSFIWPAINKIGRIDNFKPVFNGETIPGTNYSFGFGGDIDRPDEPAQWGVYVQSKAAHSDATPTDLADSYKYPDYALLEVNNRKYVILEEGSQCGSCEADYYSVWNVTTDTLKYLGVAVSCVRPRLEQDKLEFEAEPNAEDIDQCYGSYSIHYMNLN